MRILTCALAALMMSGATAALAQDAMSAGPMSPAQYVAAAGQSDEFEIREGHMAETMGHSAKVRAFGRKMVTDHTKSTHMVMAAAMKSGLPQTPPPPLTPDQQQMISQLQSAHGADFDRTYVQQQMQSHQDALSVQEGYARNGGDPALKRAAAQIVPVVKEHISMLQSIKAAT